LRDFIGGQKGRMRHQRVTCLLFLKKNIGMAYVPPGSKAPGTEITVEIRGNQAPARIVSMRFTKAAEIDGDDAVEAMNLFALMLGVWELCGPTRQRAEVSAGVLPRPDAGRAGDVGASGNAKEPAGRRCYRNHRIDVLELAEK